MFLFSIINSSFTDVPCMYVYVFSLIITYMIFYTYIGDVMSTAPFLQKCFPSVYHKEALDKSTNQYCKFECHTDHVYIFSILGCTCGIVGASWVTKKLGRKISMLIGGLVFLAGAIINAAALNIAMLINGRILLGIGLGFSNQVNIKSLNYLLFLIFFSLFCFYF